MAGEVLTESTQEQQQPTPPLEAPPSPRALIREAGPRLVREALGPLLGFYLGWKLVGLAVGVLVALAVGLSAAYVARREGRPGAVVKLALALVLYRAALGLIGHSTTIYLAQDAVQDTALGVAMLGSLVWAKRPLAEVFAGDVYDFPEIARDSDTYRAVFARITMVWGVFFLLRAAALLGVLLTGSVERYVVFAVVTGVPFLLGLMAWSISYSVRTFRATPEWEELFGAG